MRNKLIMEDGILKSICLEAGGRYIIRGESGETEEACLYAELVGRGCAGGRY